MVSFILQNAILFYPNVIKFALVSSFGVFFQVVGSQTDSSNAFALPTFDADIQPCSADPNILFGHMEW
jgi:hypothetical protein